MSIIIHFLFEFEFYFYYWNCCYIHDFNQLNISLCNLSTNYDTFLDVVEIENITPLILEIEIYVSPPFYIIVENWDENNKVNQHDIKLAPTEKYFLEIYFDSETEEKICFIYDKLLEIYFKNHVRKVSTKFNWYFH